MLWYNVAARPSRGVTGLWAPLGRLIRNMGYRPARDPDSNARSSIWSLRQKTHNCSCPCQQQSWERLKAHSPKARLSSTEARWILVSLMFVILKADILTMFRDSSPDPRECCSKPRPDCCHLEATAALRAPTLRRGPCTWSRPN